MLHYVSVAICNQFNCRSVNVCMLCSVAFTRYTVYSSEEVSEERLSTLSADQRAVSCSTDERLSFHQLFLFYSVCYSLQLTHVDDVGQRAPPLSSIDDSANVNDDFEIRYLLCVVFLSDANSTALIR